jgi:gliding motility-associated-like protein
MKPNPTLVVFQYLLMIFGLTSLNAQCPTVTNNFQSFCDIDSILLSDIEVTDNGGGVVWYETSTSTIPLSNLEGLVSGEDYYADDNTGTCGARARVDVVIYGPPTGQNFQGICLDDPSLATVADLIAVGNDVQWYLTQVGGVSLDDSTVLIDDTIYYADQANPDSSCRSSRLSVLVNVGLTPIPSGDVVQEFCVTSLFTPTVNDLTASGLNNWYISLFSALPLPESTPLVDGQTYYATTLDPPCESTGRLAVAVILTDSPNPGNDATLSLCENSNTPVDLFTVLGGSPEPGGIWSPTLSSGTGIYDPNLDTEEEYTYTVSASNTCTDQSATITITITPEPNPGTNGSLDICNNIDPIDLFDNLEGTPDSGGTWSPALASGTGIFNPAVDLPGIYTYTVSGNPPCDDVFATVNVTVTPFSDAGENGAIEICSNSSIIDLFDNLGGTPDAGGTWSPALASGTGVFDPSIDTQGIYTYSFSGNPPCTDVAATVTVTVNELPDAGTNALLELCSNDTSTVNLFDSLGGTPESGGIWSPALSSGTGIFNPAVDAAGIYTYTITGTLPCPDALATVNVTIIAEPNAGLDATLNICNNNGTVNLFDSLGGTPDSGGTWSPMLNSGTNIFDPTLDAEGIYTYTVSGVAPCADATATLTIFIIPFIDAGLDGSIELCSDDSAVDLFDSLGGTPNSGGTWSPALNSGTGFFDPSIDTEGTYTYSTTSSDPCANDSAIVVVSVIIVPDAGTDNNIELCSTNSIDLFDSLGGTPDTGGTWTPTLTSGTGIFDPNTDVEGIYTYSISSVCGNSSANITVSVAEPIDAGSNGVIELCINDTPVNLFDSLGGTPDTNGTWSPALNSGTGIFDPSIDSPGTYTYTIESNLASCPDASSSVIVSLFETPNAGSDGTLNLCNATNSVDLFLSLSGAPDSGGTWSPAMNSGTGVFDPNIDLEGIYTYTISNSCGTSSATVTVSFTNLNDAGSDGSINLCSNNAPVDLFDTLQGTPQTGGTWSPALNSGTGIFDPTIDNAGVYTYTISNTGSLCPEDSATVTITIIPPPNAGNDGTLILCADDVSLVDLFDSLGGSPDSGGTWSPALNSGTGVFDPTIDVAGIYTYTVSSTQCNLTDDTTITVTIEDVPDALGLTMTVDEIICFNTDVVVNITGANQLTDGDYTINYELSGANVSQNTTTISISGGNSFFTIPLVLLPNTGATLLTLTELFFINGSCSADTSLVDPIEILVPDIPTPQLVNAGGSFCEFDNPTIADLNTNIIESGNIIWYDQPNDGTAYSDSDLLVNGVTYYASIQAASGCESTIRLEVTVTLNDCVLELIIPDGFSPNGDTINDDFHIINLNELYPDFKLSFYNRYGNIIYEGNITSQRWDGTSRNSNTVLPVGVYFYILEFNDGTRDPIQGRVYLSQ